MRAIAYERSKQVAHGAQGIIQNYPANHQAKPEPVNDGLTFSEVTNGKGTLHCYREGLSTRRSTPNS